MQKQEARCRCASGQRRGYRGVLSRAFSAPMVKGKRTWASAKNAPPQAIIGSGRWPVRQVEVVTCVLACGMAFFNPYRVDSALWFYQG